MAIANKRFSHAVTSLIRRGPVDRTQSGRNIKKSAAAEITAELLDFSTGPADGRQSTARHLAAAMHGIKKKPGSVNGNLPSARELDILDAD